MLHFTGRTAFSMPRPQPWRLLDDITHLALAVQVLVILINFSFFSVHHPVPHASFQAEFEFIFMLNKTNYARKSNTKTTQYIGGLPIRGLERSKNTPAHGQSSPQSFFSTLPALTQSQSPWQPATHLPCTLKHGCPLTHLVHGEINACVGNNA